MKVSDSSRAAPSEQDLHAAREVLERHPNIAASASASAMEEVLAEMHRRWGSDTFRLRYGLREPRNDGEAIQASFFRGEIIADDLQKYAEREVDDRMLRTWFGEIEEILRRYSRFMQVVFELTIDPSRQPLTDDDDDEVDEMVAELSVEKSSLFSQEIINVMDFLAEARVEKQLGLVKSGPFAATTAVEMVLTASGAAHNSWNKCRESSRCHSEYEHRCPPAATEQFNSVFFALMPTPIDLTACLEEEKALARVYLRERTHRGGELVASEKLREAPVVPQSKSTNTVWHMISDLACVESCRKKAREHGQKVTGPPIRGTRDCHYSILASEEQDRALKLQEKLFGRPGVARAKALCESKYGEFRSEHLRKLRGALSVEAGLEPDAVDAMSPHEFVAAYTERILGLAPSAQETIKQKLSVERWSELAIGVDAQRQYWAITPPPEIGAIFKKSQAMELSLPGDRWKKVLSALAESPEIDSIRRDELIVRLGYLPPPSQLEREVRAMPGAVESAQIDSLQVRQKAALNRLKDTLSDLRRELLKVAEGPTERGRHCLRAAGEWIHSGFVVRYLMYDESNRLIFGQP